MDAGSNFRPESHHQSRRDKLRVHHNSNAIHHLEDLPNNYSQHFSTQTPLKPELIHVRNVRNANMLYDPSDFSPEMINFASNSNVLAAQRVAVVSEELGVGQSSKSVAMEDCLLGNSTQPVLPNFNAYRAMSGEFCGGPVGNWRSLRLHQSFDWMANFTGYSAGHENIQNPMFVREVLSHNKKVNNISASTQSVKHPYKGYHDAPSTLTNPPNEISCQDGQKQFGELHFSSPHLRSNCQEVVTSALLMQQNVRDASNGSWADGGNELALLPAYGNRTNDVRVDIVSACAKGEHCNQYGNDFVNIAKRSEEELSNIVVNDTSTQGLSLSLSSNSRPQTHIIQFGDSYARDDMHSRNAISKESQDVETNPLCSIPKPSIIGRGGKSLHDIVGTSTCTNRITGPLGPFTGYATILKSSKFLKPAQLLLDEICGVSGLKLLKTNEGSENMSRDVSVAVDATDTIETDATDEANVVVKGGNLVGSSSTFYSSNEFSCEGRGGRSSSESFRPDYQQRKAKLLYMQQEVCRRYKQYHQQMQMVVSSFESVAGLSAATPYISIALKAVSRHFRCLKNSISDQLRGISKVLGEDFSSLTTGTSCSKDEPYMSKLKYVDQNIQKQKSGGNNLNFFEQQRVWRPQRGLPERSVAILRAWLFEHFLHPYPTDTDKHILATQTGLSRNQVSNWFINARVRVWKPMVEEIHMFETEGAAASKETSVKNGDSAAGTSGTCYDQSSNDLAATGISDKQSGGSITGYSAGVGNMNGMNAGPWNQKRSRVDCQIPQSSIEGSSMGFLPYHRTGQEIGGTGAVSLTLGLRHNVESSQQQQQLQQQEDSLRWHYGGPVVHNFVG